MVAGIDTVTGLEQASGGAPNRNSLRPAVVGWVRGIVAAIAGAWLLLITFFEAGLSYPVDASIYVATTALFAAVLVRRGSLRMQAARLGGLTAVVLLLATLHFTDWSTRKPFLRDLDRVRPGMTGAEVRGIMGGYIEGTGWPAPPPDMMSKTTVTLSGGRVVSVEFKPD